MNPERRTMNDERFMHLLDKEVSPSGWSEIDPEKDWRFYISGLPNYLEVSDCGPVGGGWPDSSCYSSG